MSEGCAVPPPHMVPDYSAMHTPNWVSNLSATDAQQSHEMMKWEKITGLSCIFYTKF